LKDTVDISISHDRTKDKSPTPSQKNSPKVQKKHPVSPLNDRSFNTKEFIHENESSPSKFIVVFKVKLKVLVNIFIIVSNKG